MNSDTFIWGTAFAGAVCGIWLLQAACRSKADNALRLGSAWALLLFSIIAWSFTSGADKGVALGIAALTLIALGFLFFNALRAGIRPDRDVPVREVEISSTGWQTTLRKIWAAILIGPISGLTALSISTAMFVGFEALKMEHTANLTIIAIAFPFLWAGFAVFVGFETRALRKSVGVVGGGLLPLVYVLIVS